MKTAEQVFVSHVGQDGEEAPGRPPAGPPLAAGDLLLLAVQEPGPSTQPASLYALDLADGRPRWHKDFVHALVSGLAATPDNEPSVPLILVALSSSDLLRGEGMLLALDAAGEERYRWAPGVQRVSAPAVAGDLACVSANGRTLVLLDPGTGVERGRVELEVSASASAPALVVGDRERVGDRNGVGNRKGLPLRIVVPCRGPHLLAVGADGRPRWRFDAAGSPEPWLDRTPLVVGERVYAVLSTGAALALRLDDGTLLWQAAVGPAGKPLSAPVSDGERLYVGARDGLYALALADGRAVWHFPTARGVSAAPIVAGGVVYAACHDHHLYALDAASGEEEWHYEVERRIEVSPLLAACGDPPRLCVVVADHGGALTAVARPLSAEEHEAAGHWLEAAAAYTARGLARQRAEVLEQRARSLEEAACGDAECAAAWEAAARVWEAEGETERAATCRQAVERCMRQPVIALDVRHEGLVLGAWSRLQFTVRNEGYGPARNLVVHALGEQFEGQVTQTQRIVTLLAGREQSEWLDVRPRQHGPSVPLRVQVEYQDQAGEMRCCERTIHIAVARSEAVPREGQTVNVFVAGDGAAAVGAGAVAAGARGVAVGRDVQGAGGEKQEAGGKKQEARGGKQEAGSREQEADDVASLRRQLGEARENLRLIEERKSQYVMAVDVPLQLVKEERRLRERIAELERQLAGAVPAGAGGVAVGGDVQGDVITGRPEHFPPEEKEPAVGTGWNTAAVRDLLLAAFSDEELVTFCFDYFPAVYEELGGGMGKGQKVQRLLDYCLRHGQMEELLARVREYNPAQYARFAARLGEEAES
jgi:outer membrane protein assembly factor BamB